MALIAIFCGLGECTAAGFPNPPLGFCFTLQDLPATLAGINAESKRPGRSSARSDGRWDGAVVLGMQGLPPKQTLQSLFQAVSDTCPSVTLTPFLTPSSHYLEGYVLQER